jgi:proteasome lid subunit RPN8/RPN11
MLQISKTAMDEIQGHMEETYPHECCGLIVGAIEGEARVGVTSRRCRNLNTERAADRYELDPKDMLAAQQELEGGPWDIIGIYHSHPDHPSEPSQTDLNHAWPGWSYMIGSVANGSLAKVQSWELNDSGDRFEEESMAIQAVESREEN